MANPFFMRIEHPPGAFGSFCTGPRLAGNDLVPWADPYIAGLVDLLRRSGGELPRGGGADRAAIRNEAPLPLDVDIDESFGDDDRRQRDPWPETD